MTFDINDQKSDSPGLLIEEVQMGMRILRDDQSTKTSDSPGLLDAIGSESSDFVGRRFFGHLPVKVRGVGC